MNTLEAYEEIKNKTLYAYVGVGKHMDGGIYCVLDEIRVYDRLFRLRGVNINIESDGLVISPLFDLDADHVHEWVREGRAYLTRAIDRALFDYLQFMEALYKREQKRLVREYALGDG